jgi:hypothetical protein
VYVFEGVEVVVEVDMFPPPRFQFHETLCGLVLSVKFTVSGAHPATWSAEKLTVSGGRTDTVTVPVIAGDPQLSVTVTVYVVVTAGVALGLGQLLQLSVLDGAHA